jgi:hypothetical protein
MGRSYKRGWDIAKTGRYRSGTFAHRDIAFELRPEPPVERLTDEQLHSIYKAYDQHPQS